MRLLVLTPDDLLAPRSGFGLVAQHTAHAIIRGGGPEPAAVVIDTPRTADNDGRTTCARVVGRVQRRRAGRTRIARALLRMPLDGAEREFVELAAAASRDADVAIWFGSSWDPITAVLPRFCRCRLVHHPNDSITLFERRRARSRFRTLRVGVAALQERRGLTAGYATTVYVTEQDAAEACQLAPGEQIVAIPLGVDLDAFRPAQRANGGSTEILFVGVMAYRPNHEAAMYLIERVLPLLPPSARVRVVGREPSSVLRAAAARDPRVEVTGEVDDIAAEYRRATVFAAPIISGAGFRNKLLEAMASGLPVVTTSLVADSFGSLPPGVLVADDAQQFAAHLTTLLADPERRCALGSASRAFIESGWSWDHRTERLMTVASAGR